MLSALPPLQVDPIIRLMALFHDDPRPDKVDLGVGVYRTDTGDTPILSAVKLAEAKILRDQTSKGYVAMTGDPAFHAAVARILFGPDLTEGRLAAAATPGGTSAVRQLMEVAQLAKPNGTVWISDPSWPNHAAIAAHIGMKVRHYRYYDRTSGGLDRDGMMDDLSRAETGDLVVLHASCHNPTGVDLTDADWAALADLFAGTGAVPLVDAAYLGFGTGVEADTAGLRLLATRLPEMMVAVSGSKNFGLYRDRAAMAYVLAADAEGRGLAQGALTALNRQAFAFPPDHGARVVTTILEDADLRADWEAELSGMRARITSNRTKLAAALQAAMGSDRFGFLATHRGMFSLLGLDEAQVIQLRDEFGIYVVTEGRVNLAGITDANVERVAQAVAAVAG